MLTRLGLNGYLQKASTTMGIEGSFEVKGAGWSDFLEYLRLEERIAELERLNDREYFQTVELPKAYIQAYSTQEMVKHWQDIEAQTRGAYEAAKATKNIEPSKLLVAENNWKRAETKLEEARTYESRAKSYLTELTGTPFETVSLDTLAELTSRPATPLRRMQILELKAKQLDSLQRMELLGRAFTLQVALSYSKTTDGMQKTTTATLSTNDLVDPSRILGAMMEGKSKEAADNAIAQERSRLFEARRQSEATFNERYNILMAKVEDYDAKMKRLASLMRERMEYQTPKLVGTTQYDIAQASSQLLESIEGIRWAYTEYMLSAIELGIFENVGDLGGEMARVSDVVPANVQAEREQLGAWKYLADQVRFSVGAKYTKVDTTKAQQTNAAAIAKNALFIATTLAAFNQYFVFVPANGAYAIRPEFQAGYTAEIDQTMGDMEQIPDKIRENAQMAKQMKEQKSAEGEKVDITAGSTIRVNLREAYAELISRGAREDEQRQKAIEARLADSDAIVAVATNYEEAKFRLSMLNEEIERLKADIDYAQARALWRDRAAQDRVYMLQRRLAGKLEERASAEKIIRTLESTIKAKMLQYGEFQYVDASGALHPIDLSNVTDRSFEMVWDSFKRSHPALKQLQAVIEGNKAVYDSTGWFIYHFVPELNININFTPPSASARLTWTIYDSGERQALNTRAYLDMEKTKQLMEMAGTRLGNYVLSLNDKMQYQEEAKVKALEAWISARESLRIVREKWQNGEYTDDRLRQAEDAESEARREYTSAFYAQQNTIVSFLETLKTLGIPFESNITQAKSAEEAALAQGLKAITAAERPAIKLAPIQTTVTPEDVAPAVDNLLKSLRTNYGTAKPTQNIDAALKIIPQSEWNRVFAYLMNVHGLSKEEAAAHMTGMIEKWLPFVMDKYGTIDIPDYYGSFFYRTTRMDSSGRINDAANGKYRNLFKVLGMADYLQSMEEYLVSKSGYTSEDAARFMKAHLAYTWDALSGKIESDAARWHTVTQENIDRVGTGQNDEAVRQRRAAIRQFAADLSGVRDLDIDNMRHWPILDLAYSYVTFQQLTSERLNFLRDTMIKDIKPLTDQMFGDIASVTDFPREALSRMPEGTWLNFLIQKKAELTAKVGPLSVEESSWLKRADSEIGREEALVRTRVAIDRYFKVAVVLIENTDLDLRKQDLLDQAEKSEKEGRSEDAQKLREQAKGLTARSIASMDQAALDRVLEATLRNDNWKAFLQKVVDIQRENGLTPDLFKSLYYVTNRQTGPRLIKEGPNAGKYINTIYDREFKNIKAHVVEKAPVVPTREEKPLMAPEVKAPVTEEPEVTEAPRGEPATPVSTAAPAAAKLGAGLTASEAMLLARQPNDPNEYYRFNLLDANQKVRGYVDVKVDTAGKQTEISRIYYGEPTVVARIPLDPVNGKKFNKLILKYPQMDKDGTEIGYYMASRNEATGKETISPELIIFYARQAPIRDARYSAPTPRSVVDPQAIAPQVKKILDVIAKHDPKRAETLLKAVPAERWNEIWAEICSVHRFDNKLATTHLEGVARWLDTMMPYVAALEKSGVKLPDQFGKFMYDTLPFEETSRMNEAYASLPSILMYADHLQLVERSRMIGSKKPVEIHRQEMAQFNFIIFDYLTKYRSDDVKLRLEIMEIVQRMIDMGFNSKDDEMGIGVAANSGSIMELFPEWEYKALISQSETILGRSDSEAIDSVYFFTVTQNITPERLSAMVPAMKELKDVLADAFGDISKMTPEEFAKTPYGVILASQLETIREHGESDIIRQNMRIDLKKTQHKYTADRLFKFTVALIEYTDLDLRRQDMMDQAAKLDVEGKVNEANALRSQAAALKPRSISKMDKAAIDRVFNATVRNSDWRAFLKRIADIQRENGKTPDFFSAAYYVANHQTGPRLVKEGENKGMYINTEYDRDYKTPKTHMLEKAPAEEKAAKPAVAPAVEGPAAAKPGEPVVIARTPVSVDGKTTYRTVLKYSKLDENGVEIGHYITIKNEATGEETTTEGWGLDGDYLGPNLYTDARSIAPTPRTIVDPAAIAPQVKALFDVLNKHDPKRAQELLKAVPLNEWNSVWADISSVHRMNSKQAAAHLEGVAYWLDKLLPIVLQMERDGVKMPDSFGMIMFDTRPFSETAKMEKAFRGISSILMYADHLQSIEDLMALGRSGTLEQDRKSISEDYFNIFDLLGRHKNDPANQDLRMELQKVQRHMTSLGFRHNESEIGLGLLANLEAVLAVFPEWEYKGLKDVTELVAQRVDRDSFEAFYLFTITQNITPDRLRSMVPTLKELKPVLTELFGDIDAMTPEEIANTPYGARVAAGLATVRDSKGDEGTRRALEQAMRVDYKVAQHKYAADRLLKFTAILLEYTDLDLRRQDLLDQAVKLDAEGKTDEAKTLREKAAELMPRSVSNMDKLEVDRVFNATVRNPDWQAFLKRIVDIQKEGGKAPDFFTAAYYVANYQTGPRLVTEGPNKGKYISTQYERDYKTPKTHILEIAPEAAPVKREGEEGVFYDVPAGLKYARAADNFWNVFSVETGKKIGIRTDVKASADGTRLTDTGKEYARIGYVGTYRYITYGNGEAVPYAWRGKTAVSLEEDNKNFLIVKAGTIEIKNGVVTGTPIFIRTKQEAFTGSVNPTMRYGDGGGMIGENTITIEKGQRVTETEVNGKNEVVAATYIYKLPTGQTVLSFRVRYDTPDRLYVGRSFWPNGQVKSEEVLVARLESKLTDPMPTERGDMYVTERRQYNDRGQLLNSEGDYVRNVRENLVARKGYICFSYDEEGRALLTCEITRPNVNKPETRVYTAYEYDAAGKATKTTYDALPSEFLGKTVRGPAEALHRSFVALGGKAIEKYISVEDAQAICEVLYVINYTKLAG
ncbi:MAG: TolC family protein, partial [Candidatus Omnitrophota bacterium]